MKHPMAFLTLLLICIACSPQQTPKKAFSFHLFQEPLHLDPALSRASSSSYLFHNTLRGLYIFHAKRGLRSEGGSCSWKSKLHLICDLNKDFFWSNNQPVVASDYVRSFRHLINPLTASPRANLLENLKNAKSILKGTSKLETLGIKALGDFSLEIRFSNPDPEFLFKLSSTALVPQPLDQALKKENYKTFLSNGPYTIESWNFGKDLYLSPNKKYKKGHPKRPLVQVYFIDNEMTAYRLYENGRLSLLRRTPSNMIDVLKQRSDFYQIPMARYDYIGFGPSLKELPHLRKALALSVNYNDFQTLLRALGRPGCPSLPHSWMDKVPCYGFNLKEAKEELSKVSPDALKRTFKLKVSQLGGLDIKKQAVFLQNQWKVNLGLNIEVSQVEQKVFLNELKTNPPDIFRKGVGIDRPTCLSALETFSEEGKQNYISWNNPNYQKLLLTLSTNLSERLKKPLCREGVEMLMKDHWIIPLGEMHFTILAKPQYKGWSINSINQLDLSQLHPTF